MRMIGLLLLAGSFWATSASASHMIECTIEARVVSVDNLARLDGKATFASSTIGPMEDDFEQTVTLELTEVGKSIREPCPAEGSQVTLHVPPEQQGEFQTGMELTLKYSDYGGAAGRNVTWIVVQEPQ